MKQPTKSDLRQTLDQALDLIELLREDMHTYSNALRDDTDEFLRANGRAPKGADNADD